jgi:hypothetical protein
MNFVKNMAQGTQDPNAHKKLVRFGLGDYQREEFTMKKGGSFVQIQGGFEYLDTLQHIMSTLMKDDIDVVGKIVARESIKDKLVEFDIEPTKADSKCKKVEVKFTISPGKFAELLESFSDCFLLLSLKSGKYMLKSGKSAPKPGSLKEKYTTAKFELSDIDLLKKEFLFDMDVDKFKLISIKQTYVMENIDVPKEFENDVIKARLNSRRSGTVKRLITIDGEEHTKDFKFKEV